MHHLVRPTAADLGWFSSSRQHACLQGSLLDVEVPAAPLFPSLLPRWRWSGQQGCEIHQFHQRLYATVKNNKTIIIIHVPRFISFTKHCMQQWKTTFSFTCDSKYLQEDCLMVE
jgi:hypothetical protein